ncbi:protein Mo25 isoform X2 [Glycine max]|uniref:protein Mo25 isoform X2 n=1 Tax=Glycine max TaxID=3847 RepID=UPI0003DEAC7A|nr:protein Mo25 isoform X2 [Glycine max]
MLQIQILPKRAFPGRGCIKRQKSRKEKQIQLRKFILEVRYLKVMMTLLRVFIANPNKPREVKIILSKNQEKPLELLHNLSPGKGSEDEQFEEGKEFIIKEIERLSS